MTIEAMSSAPLRSHVAEMLHQKSQRRRYVLLLQKREVKDYCVGLIKNVLFCLQFFSLSIVSPPSQRKSRRSHSSGCIAATRQMQKMNWKKTGKREKMHGWPTMAENSKERWV